MRAIDLVSQFQQFAIRLPQGIAVIDDQEYTYQELDRRSNQLASYLRDLGVRNEKVVATYLPRSASVITAALAILKANGVWLPLDNQHPPQRLTHLLSQANAALVLADETLPRIEVAGARYIASTQLEAQMKNYPISSPAIEPTLSEQAAYILYTSGSTGTPKGIVISRDNISHYITQVSSGVTGLAASMPLFTLSLIHI